MELRIPWMAEMCFQLFEAHLASMVPSSRTVCLQDPLDPLH